MSITLMIGLAELFTVACEYSQGHLAHVAMAAFVSGMCLGQVWERWFPEKERK